MTKDMVDVRQLAREKAAELVGRSTVEAWGALASLWGRLFVLATSGWLKWPDARATVEESFLAALRVSIGQPPEPRRLQELVTTLDGFAVEDDGSAEWQHAIDLVAMLLDALRGIPLAIAVENALLWSLEGEVNVLSNEYAVATGKPIFRDEARERLEKDPRWVRVIATVRAL